MSQALRTPAPLSCACCSTTQSPAKTVQSSAQPSANAREGANSLCQSAVKASEKDVADKGRLWSNAFAARHGCEHQPPARRQRQAGVEVNHKQNERPQGGALSEPEAGRARCAEPCQRLYASATTPPKQERLSSKTASCRSSTSSMPCELRKPAWPGSMPALLPSEDVVAPGLRNCNGCATSGLLHRQATHAPAPAGKARGKPG